MMQSPALKSLLLELRQHPAFPDLLRLVPAPRLPRFRRSQAAKAEEARAEWVHASGCLDQHEAWIYALTGQVPERDSETSQQEKS